MTRRERTAQAEFESLRRERRRTDELTEASEKLAAPMLNRFDYQSGPDGELYFQGQSLGEVFDTGVAVAEELVSSYPQFAIELLRRHIERDEYRAMRALAAGEAGEPDVLVVLSPLPDAVVSGSVELDAYDLDRQVTMVRVFERTPGGIRASSLSLDRSDRSGLQSIAGLFGEQIADDASSEDILAMRLLGWRHEFDGDVARLARRTYDDQLARQLGGRWYAGRQDGEVLDALEFIEKQTDLITEHESVLDDLETAGADDQLLKRARYNFAAALSRRLRGDSELGSLAEAGDVAAANGETYADNCPTAGRSAAQSAEALGFQMVEQWKRGVCVVCGRKSLVGGCSICSACADAHTRGGDAALNRIMNQAQSRQVKPAARPISPEARSVTTKTDKLIRRYGRYAVRGSLRIVTGGKEYDVHDSRDGRLLGSISA